MSYCFLFSLTKCTSIRISSTRWMLILGNLPPLFYLPNIHKCQEYSKLSRLPHVPGILQTYQASINARNLATLFLIQQKVQNPTLTAGRLLRSTDLLYLASQAANLGNRRNEWKREMKKRSTWMTMEKYKKTGKTEEKIVSVQQSKRTEERRLMNRRVKKKNKRNWPMKRKDWWTEKSKSREIDLWWEKTDELKTQKAEKLTSEEKRLMNRRVKKQRNWPVKRKDWWTGESKSREIDLFHLVL